MEHELLGKRTNLTSNMLIVYLKTIIICLECENIMKNANTVMNLGLCIV